VIEFAEVLHVRTLWACRGRAVIEMHLTMKTKVVGTSPKFSIFKSIELSPALLDFTDIIIIIINELLKVA